MVENFANTGMGQNGSWSISKIVILIDKEPRTLTVPENCGKRVTYAIKDVRLALPDDSFVKTVENAIDTIEKSIDETND